MTERSHSSRPPAKSSVASSMLHFALLATVASKCPTPKEIMQNLTVDYDAQAHPGLMTSESVPGDGFRNQGIHME